MKVRIDVSGASEMLKDLKRMGLAGQVAAKTVFGRFTGRVVPKAQGRTPVEPEDGGALRDSVRATKPTTTRTGLVSAGVIAGGAPLARALAKGHHKANVYAVVQHEDLTLKHTVGGPKFIERPFLQEVERVPDELLAEMDRVRDAG